MTKGAHLSVEKCTPLGEKVRTSCPRARKSPFLTFLINSDGYSNGLTFRSALGAKDPSVYAFTVYAAGRGLVCDEFSTHSDASRRKPPAIQPTIARASASADL
jgi:hypothetical protein